MAELELTLAAAITQARGGLATVHTDVNGQATVTFPVPFAVAPSAIIATPKDNLVAVGVLVLTEAEVMVWVWDLVTNAWHANADVELYWIGLF